MIQALDVRRVVQLVALLTLLLAVAAVFAESGGGAAKALWHAKSWIVAVPSVLIFALTFRPIFRFFYRFTFARQWLFPDLDGEWIGEIHSNWPRIRTMMEAARQTGRTFNALSDPIPPEMDMSPVQVKATIQAGLLNYKIELRMSEARQSETVFVKPVWRKPDRPRLFYMYRQCDNGKISETDTAEHHGAAWIDYDEAGQELSGPYWTERKGEQGLNTAGRIRLRRAPLS